MIIPNVILKTTYGLFGEDRTKYGGPYAPGVEGYRYYVPILYTITVEPIAVTGTATIKHFATDGTSLSHVFNDQTITMTSGQNYNFTHPANTSYSYRGWKSSTASPPSGGSPTTSPADPPALTPYDGSFPHYYINFYYDKPAAEGTVNIRHMVRTGANGAFAQAGGSSETLAVPSTKTYLADGSYGTIVGKSLSYSSYSNTPSSGSSVSVHVTAAQTTAYVTFFYERAPTLTGDFDVLPGTINFRESFTLRPKNFQLGACTYLSHRYKIERSGIYTSPAVSGKYSDTTYSYGSYPWNIGVGTHMISLQIATSCGTSSWIGPKTLTVNSPSTNSPPQFKIGFVDPANPNVPLHRVVAGSKLDLVYINDPSVPTPTDPDGDLIHFNGFDFASGTAFVKSIPSKGIEYVDGFHQITMDTVGFHSVTGMMSDTWGASSTASTYIEVVPPNPVPVAECPAVVIENHPVDDSLYNADRSYSPIGRAIDHSRNEWLNRRPSYPNGTTGTITLQLGLHVYDSAGLKSLTPGSCTIAVKPDLPPAAKLDVPSVGIRNTVINLFNKSTSPDGDRIVQAEYRFKYDVNNNGFADDNWVNAAGSLTKLSFNASRVGKYLFYLKVTEEYGKSGDTSSTSAALMTLDIVNDAPEISFDMEGENPQPDLNAYATDTTASMMNWASVETNSSRPLAVPKSHLWRVQEGKLVSGEGRNFGNQAQNVLPYSGTRVGYEHQSWEAWPTNNGYGNNRLSPWRSAASGSTVQTTLIHPNRPGFYWQFQAGGWLSGFPQLFSNKKNIFFMVSEYSYSSGKHSYTDIIKALNPKKLSPTEWYAESPYAMYLSVRYSGEQNPYDFEIKQPAWKEQKFLTDYGWVQKYPEKHKIQDYALANGRYLYTKEDWSVSNYPTSGNIAIMKEVAVYDALTGARIDSTFNHQDKWNYKSWPYGPDGDILYAKGDNIVLREYVNNDWILTEINPRLEAVRTATIKPPTPVNPRIDEWRSYGTTLYPYNGIPQFDALGNFYMYQGYYLMNGGKRFYDLSVVKYNADFTLAWRKYLYPPDAMMRALHHGDTYIGSYGYPDTWDGLILDPANHEVLVKDYYEYTRPGDIIPMTYENVSVLDAGSGALKHRVSNQHGGDLTLYHYGSPHKSDTGTSFSVNWNGGRSGGGSYTVTAEGNKTGFDGPNAVCPSPGVMQQEGANKVYNAAGAQIGTVGVPCNDGRQIFGEYFGDGVYVSASRLKPVGYTPQHPDGILTLSVSVGQPSTAPKVVKSFTQGQFISSGTMDNAEVNYSFSMLDVDYDSEWLGFSFRMQDPMNRYSVETNGSSMELVKYVNGGRTVLKSAGYPMQDNTAYNVRLKFVGSQIDVWLNGTPILSASDTTYTDGKYGYWGDKAFITFSDIRRRAVAAAQNWSGQYAIWDPAAGSAAVKYSNIAFSDPENDPFAGTYQWTISHTPRFINSQGLSAKHGQTFASPQLTFDKVGDYTVTLQAKDDPNPSYRMPSMVFDAYRKLSNPFQRKVTVHRRPISDYTVIQDPATKKIVWTDASRDPDRYESASNYSTEATGINYAATKGILEKKFYYIAPSGAMSPTKLVTPAESGTYEIGMAVRDEYDSWSEYTVRYLTIGALPPANQPPVPGFTAVPGTTVRGATVTIDSTASDAEDGGRTNLVHTYYIRNLTAGGPESVASTSRTNWTKAFSSVGTFRIRQVVEDSSGAEAETTRDITINNRLPDAAVTVPASADQHAPTRLTVLRPTFQWSYSDPDGDSESRYQIRIYRYDGQLEADSGVRNGSFTSWTIQTDLPERVNFYIRVNVHDGYDWSGWSAPKYFYIETNRPPVADIDWSPKPVYEGDSLGLRAIASDPDGDPLTYAWSLNGPAGYSRTFSGPFPEPGALLPGTYTAHLTVNDGKVDATAMKTISVRPLTITANVAHTEAWRSHHEEAGHETVRDPKDFYAGERFVVGVLTAAAPVTRVEVALHAQDFKHRPLNTIAALTLSGQPNHYGGELWDERWASLTDGLPKGTYQLNFAVTYRNGVVKRADIPVRIIGSVLGSVSVHRQQ